MTKPAFSQEKTEAEIVLSDLSRGTQLLRDGVKVKCKGPGDRHWALCHVTFNLWMKGRFFGQCMGTRSPPAPERSGLG